MTCHVDGPLLYTNRTPYYRRWPTQKAPKSSPPRGWTGIAFSFSAATVVACELQQSCENDAIGTCERWDISRPVRRLALSTRGPSGAPHPAARPTAPGTDSAGAESEAVLKAKLLPVRILSGRTGYCASRARTLHSKNGSEGQQRAGKDQGQRNALAWTRGCQEQKTSA